MSFKLSGIAAIVVASLVLSACGGGVGSFGGSLGGKRNVEIPENGEEPVKTRFFGLVKVKQEVPPSARSAQSIFSEAEFEFSENNYEKAAFLFSEVERLHPLSTLARKALLRSAYSNHKNRNYDQSRAEADRFLQFYPADEQAAFASYLIGLSYYNQIDDVSRDQGITYQALQALRATVERYPDSEYATSALLKFDLALDQLAGKEMNIGRYYLRRGHYGAAINRFRVVVEDFETTSHTPEALHRLVEAYLSLGLTADAQTAGAILGYNFKATTWYQDSYVLLTDQGISTEGADPKASRWLNRIWRRVVKGNWI